MAHRRFTKQREFNKKVFALKFSIIILIGIILGVSCLFSKTIETALGIGEKQKSYVDSEVIKDSKLTVHYVDVGQGDATFIFLPDGTNMLIDAGTEEASEQLVSYIKSLGVRQINYFVVTHSDADHTGGAEEILTNFEVKTIYRPFQIAVNKDGTPIEKEDLSEYYILNSEKCNPVSTSTYVEFINCVYDETYNENGQTKKAEVIVSYDGIKIEPTFGEEEFLIEFFAPFKTSMTPFDCDYTKGYPVDTYNNVNNDISPIILLEYKEASFLFTGDAGTSVEEDLISSLNAQEKLRFDDIDVYQAGHHGANNSNSQEFIDFTTPDYVVVSAGKNNSHGHPTPEFIDKINNYTHSSLDYILRTDQINNIVFGFDSEGNLAYTAFASGGGTTIFWWQIAVGIFVISFIVVVSVKVTKNKQATAKRVYKKTRQVTKLYKKK